MKPGAEYTVIALTLLMLVCAETHTQENVRASKRPSSLVNSEQKPNSPSGTATVTLVGRSTGNIRAVDQHGNVEEIRATPLTIVGRPTTSAAQLKREEARRRSELLKSIQESHRTTPLPTAGRSMAEGDIPPPPPARSKRPPKATSTSASGRSQPFVIQSESVKTDEDVDLNPPQ